MSKKFRERFGEISETYITWKLRVKFLEKDSYVLGNFKKIASNVRVNFEIKFNKT